MRSKPFLISFLISLPLFWGLNVFAYSLEDLLLWQEFAYNPQLLTAQANQEVLTLKFKNLRNSFQNQEDLELTAKAGISVELKSSSIDSRADQQKVIFKKNIKTKLPIASLSKLMTALVVLENYPLSQEVEITKQAVLQEEDIGEFKAGERLLVRDLLYSLLVESSNDAAFALAEVIGQASFADLMNLSSKSLGLDNTYFINPSGLDPDNPENPHNYSTAEDLAKLTAYLLKKHNFIWQILGSGEKDIFNPDGSLHHHIKTTNQLFGKIPGIVGGKTGYTDQAQGCFILVVKSPETGDYLINVILGSQDRFVEMQRLIEWAMAGK